MDNNKKTTQQSINKSKPWYKKFVMMITSLCVLFVFIGILTTIQPAYRFSSTIISDSISKIEGSSFLYLMGMENRAFKKALPKEMESIDWSDLVFQLATSIKPNDVRSLLGREIPGFGAYQRKIVIAEEGTDYTNLPIESSPPLDVVLTDQESTEPIENTSDIPGEKKEADQPTTGDRNVVFIYNTHNRESFLPYLSEGTNINQVYHSEVNITKVSDRLAENLERNGIGTKIDDTDIGTVLREKGWEYWQSYDASKPVVKQALANNKHIQYVFDLHRDSQRKEVTTTTIKGVKYASLAFIVGSEYRNDKNLKLATELHKKINAKYPGLSRTVVEQGGSGHNGVYNQDLSENAILIEFGGVDNTFEELYRTSDVLAEIFSDYYWDAEKVQAN